MKVCVGSCNPVKIEAVREAFREFFGSEVDVAGVKVDSGVPDQPYGLQTVQGAINRANAIQEPADFYVGVESGIFTMAERAFVFNAIYLRDSRGRSALGFSPWFELHESLFKRIREKHEMEEAIEELTGIEKIGDRMGAIGIFTNGAMDRRNFTKAGVLAALAGYYQRERVRIPTP